MELDKPEQPASEFRVTALRISQELADLVAEKNAAYGSSFEDTPYILRKLYPDGIPTESYEDALGIVRVLDKLKRIATKKGAFGENPWKDVAGYGLVQMTVAELRNHKSAELRNHKSSNVCDENLPCIAHPPLREVRR